MSLPDKARLALLQVPRRLKAEVPEGKEASFWAGKTIYSALSGGRDSVCLLKTLSLLSLQMGFHLEAVHVNHGLRQNARRDEDFCRHLCTALHIPLKVFAVDVPSYAAAHHLSTEDAARILRYDCFRRLSSPYIALAHYQSDQAETVLLHLLRGSGLKGLGGMQSVSLQEGLVLLRPFLSVSGEELDAFVQEQSLTYVTDETNADPSYTRNRIRRELMPLLETSYNPSITRTLCRTASILSEEEAFLDQAAHDALRDPLKASYLRSLPPALQRRVCLLFLEQAGLSADVSFQNVEDFLKLAHTSGPGALSLPKGLTARKADDILLVQNLVLQAEPSAPDLSGFFIEEVPGREGKITPENAPEKWLDARYAKESLVWRFRREGDYLVIRRAGREGAAGENAFGRKSLKKFLSEQKIPREERGRIPLLCSGSYVLWVFGYRVSDNAWISGETKTVVHAGRKKDAE